MLFWTGTALFVIGFLKVFIPFLSKTRAAITPEILRPEIGTGPDPAQLP